MRNGHAAASMSALSAWRDQPVFAADQRPAPPGPTLGGPTAPGAVPTPLGARPTPLGATPMPLGATPMPLGGVPTLAGAGPMPLGGGTCMMLGVRVLGVSVPGVSVLGMVLRVMGDDAPRRAAGGRIVAPADGAAGGEAAWARTGPVMASMAQHAASKRHRVRMELPPSRSFAIAESTERAPDRFRPDPTRRSAGRILFATDDPRVDSEGGAAAVAFTTPGPILDR